MKLLEKAEMVARWAHRNQTDLSGMPYWIHCANVAANLKAAGYDEVVQAIGWCHDVVEDTDVGIQDLYDLFCIEQWDNERFCRGVWSMTQHPGMDLETYWACVKQNEDARIVKLYGDIPDNDDPQRGLRLEATKPGLRAKQKAKYERARKFLMTDEEWLDWKVGQ